MMVPRTSAPSGGNGGGGHHHHQQQQPQPPRSPAARGRSNSSSPPEKAPPRQQPQHTTDELQFAKRTLQKLVQDSHFFPVCDKNNRVQTIKENEMDFGSVLGKGGFCEVRCTSLKYYPRNQSQGQRTSSAASSSPLPKYAMKYLSPSKTSSSRVFQRGIADLAMEACFLSLLRHENIIGLHYVSEGSLEENYNCNSAAHHHNHHSHQHQQQHGHDNHRGGHDEVVMDARGNLQLRRTSMPPPPPSSNHFFGYFLLLDPLYETLTDRIEKTYVSQVINQSSSGNHHHHNNKMWDRIVRHNKRDSSTHQEIPSPKVLLAQRLEILKCIASALRYLHDDCHIVFRDVKPDNIGFYRRYHPQCSCGYYQSRGSRDGCTCFEEVTKLFDFGLAKELKPKHRKTHPAYPDQDTYKLTGCTGSRRYMAPEVCFSDPYNQKADVYSYGMLMYQVSSLVTPFDGFSMGRHEREVLRGGYRPDVKIPSSSATPSFLKGKSKSEEQMLVEGGSAGSEMEKKMFLLALKTKRSWPKELPRLMEECWDYDMRYRPEMKEVTYRLERCIDDLVQKSTSLAIVPGHWPKFSHTPSKEHHHEACAVTAGTIETFPMTLHPMSSHTFSHSGGFVDSTGQLMHSPMMQTSAPAPPQYQYVQQGYHSTSTMVVATAPGRTGRINESDIYSSSNISNQAVYRQQKRRNSYAEEEPLNMQWERY